ncbi:MAG: methyl-accepting chemotaxis protein [Burkholderiaceae bacterium]|jgi:twitching motility protein PilJ|nr:methyl-accepting chemotaxis protein [Burkholderiaceae bacterium]
MAFSLFKKKPDLYAGNNYATTAPAGSAARADDASSFLDALTDSTHDTRDATESSAVFDSVLESQSKGIEQEPSGSNALSLSDLPTALRFQRVFLLILTVALIGLVAGGWWVVSRTNRVTRQLNDVSSALAQSHRLAKSVSQPMAGHGSAFKELRQSADALAHDVGRLRSDLGDDWAGDLSVIAPLAGRLEQSVGAIVTQQKLLDDMSRALRAIDGQSEDLLTAAEQVSVLKVQQGASLAEVSAAGRLVMLTQHIGKSTGEMLAAGGVSPDTVAAFDKDLTSAHGIAQGLLSGSPELRLPAARDPDTRGKLQNLLKMLDQTRSQAASILSNPRGLNDAHTAQSAVAADSEALAQALGSLQARLSAVSGLNWQSVVALLIPALVVLLAAAGLASVQSRSDRQRQWQAQQQRLTADRQQQDAKRISEANQAAILRLMNELQAVAEGDLTQAATVTEDITGAIADSVNYTVEELRTLVGNVQGAATRVTETTSKVELTSTELLAVSAEQLREIRETGQSVVDMAGRINQVSAQAQESAQVARQSLQAAASGLTAVQDSIGGMNTIRDQIQETSKRIKRLGESSQEIGEITELISDITEQTNVLALNAAIQAASAGEAGRGFSVVAEEVQRLAERSAEATRQIAALVKAIQTDTQDAVAAMERSTRGVVEGAHLSDNAGTALTEIDRVSRRLAQLIEQISSATVQEAQKANAAAGNIQHIFAVTEQTGESTRSTTDQVRELARIADELRQSVARFKIA